MSEPSRPLQKRPEVIEVEAVPLEHRRPRVQKRRPKINMLWAIPVVIVFFLAMKFLAILAIGVILLFALPRLIPGGWSGLVRALLPKGRK